MVRSLLAPPLRSVVDPRSEAFQKNRADVLEQLAEIVELVRSLGAAREEALLS